MSAYNNREPALRHLTVHHKGISEEIVAETLHVVGVEEIVEVVQPSLRNTSQSTS